MVSSPKNFGFLLGRKSGETGEDKGKCGEGGRRETMGSPAYAHSSPHMGLSTELGRPHLRLSLEMVVAKMWNMRCSDFFWLLCPPEGIPGVSSWSTVGQPIDS